MCESLGIKSDVNMFINDKLVTEHHPYKSDQKLSATKGIGDAEEYIVDKAGKALSFNSKEGKAEDGFGDNVADKDVIDVFEDVKLTESETRINNILMGKGKDVVVKEGNIIVKQPLSLLSTLEKLDEVVSIVTGEKKKKQLSEAEELLQSL